MVVQLVGDFSVNGRQAFCLQHSKKTPTNGTGLTTNIYYDENVRKALYYGWGGAEQWTGFQSREHGIVVTSLALSHFYSGDHIRTIAQDFIDFLNTKSVPNYKVRFSKSNVSAYKEGDIQRTETIELISGMTSGSVNVDLQNEVTFVNEIDGYRQTGGNVTIYGQTRFHLEAPTTVALGRWTTGNKSQGFAYQPIVGTTGNSTIQDIGYLDMVYDPSETTSLTVDWLQLGSFRLHKIDNKGENVEGASVKLSYNSDMSDAIGIYQTKTDGTILVENIRTGILYYQEVGTPNHLKLDNTIRSVNIDVGNITEVDLTNNWKQGYIQIIKKDKETQKTIKQAGVEFEILSNGKKVTTITTNANGIAKTNILPYGSYTVKEKKSPYNYAITDTVQEVNVYEDNKIYEIDIYNERVKGQLNLSKVDIITGKIAQGEATLEGAVYGLYARTPIYNPNDGNIVYNTDTKVGELTTNSEGNATMSNLYLGEYYLKEITPSKGYTLDTRQYNFDLKYENQNVKVVTKSVSVQERVISQAFQIIKISSDENGEAQLLAGAEFTVKSKKDIEKYGSWEKAPIAKNANGKEVSILVTDNKGSAISEKLPYGEYIVRETKVPDNKYKVPDFTVKIQKDSDTPQVWRVFNDTSFKAILKIVKQDEETGKTVQISGAKFRIKNVETGKYFGYWKWNPLPQYIDSWVTTDTGIVLTDQQLPSGKYEIEEIESPKGYLISDRPIEFEIASNVAYETLEDGSTIVITVVQNDKPVKGKINIEKRGEVLIDFKDGEFIYEEKGLSNAKYNIFAKEDIFDPSNDGTVLYRRGTIVETVVSNKEGKATSKELPLGSYSVQEVQAPNGFVLDSETKDVSLTYAGQEIAIVYNNLSFLNQRQKVNINVIKKDEDDGTKLQGANFGIYAKEDIYNHNNEIIISEGELIQTVISNELGEVHFNVDLPLMKFEIKEIEPPKGYASSNQSIEVNAEYQSQETEKLDFEYEFKNKIIQVEVSKKDITNNSEIEGAYIIVFEKDNDGAIFDKWVSGCDGKEDDGTIKPHILKGLEVGKTYVMREISSPYGYAIAQDVEFTVEDTKEIQKIEMKDEVVFGQLEWNKTGEIFMAVAKGNSEFGETFTPAWHEANIKGAEITIYASEDIKIGNTVYYQEDEEIEVLKSGKENVISKKLPVGRYYYIETKTPSGYVQNTDKHYFEIKDNQTTELQVVSTILRNGCAKINIDLTKVLEKQDVFENNEAYKDVQFGIYARKDIHNYIGKVAIKKGSLIVVSGIDEAGHLINVPDLPNGSYYIKELSTNPQYLLDNKEYDFKVSYHGKDVSEYTIQIGNKGIIKNKLARGTLQIVKYDSYDSNKKLENVEFNISIKKDMSKIIKTIKTNEQGIAILDNVEIGKYYIQEAKQVNGYISNNNIYEAEVKANGDLLTIHIYNKPTQMEFSKVDETGEKELLGATIQIIDKETGEVIEEWVSTEQTHIIHYLVEGKEYIMKEITAPNGYEIAEEIIFTAGDGKKVTMKDKPIREIEIPKTGDESKINIWFTILIVSVLGLVSIVAISKNQKRKAYKE